MTRFIFIFSIIDIVFLTIVRFPSFAHPKSDSVSVVKTENATTSETVIFEDNFESATIYSWKQTTDWEVSASDKISGEFSLKHSAKATGGNSYTFHKAKTDLKTRDLEWSFSLKNGNWDPSSSNRFWFYLCSDTTQTNLINGWAAGVNISGNSDLLELWRFKNGKADSLIVVSDLDWNASLLAAINVKRTAKGNWTLQYQKTGEPKSKVFTGFDRLSFNFTNTGIFFNYTATRAGQLWLDDVRISGSPALPFIEKLTIAGPQLILITFNNPIAEGSVHSSNFSLTDENNQQIPVEKAVVNSDNNRTVDITFGKVSGRELQLKVSGITDFTGKAMLPDVLSFLYVLPPGKGSVLINEVLFNPFSGGSDFVELVNVLGVPVALNQLKIATRNEAGELKQIYTVSADKRILQPGEYLVCTKTPETVMAQYANNNPQAFCSMSSFPSLPDDGGTVVLLNNSQEIIDEFYYSAKMHSPFLASEEGVSLERISLEKPTDDATNWASAAESAGFATPGLPNSQTRNEEEMKDQIICEPQAFSPNGDDMNDELTIKFQLDKPGYIANVRIFDAVGRLVNHLAKNQSLAQEGSWTWDGKSQSGQKQPIGVYITLIELFDKEGHQKVFKKTCTVTDRTE